MAHCTQCRTLLPESTKGELCARCIERNRPLAPIVRPCKACSGQGRELSGCDGMMACAVCGGSGSETLPCCPTCRGSGRTGDAICATCLGSRSPIP